MSVRTALAVRYSTNKLLQLSLVCKRCEVAFVEDVSGELDDSDAGLPSSRTDVERVDGALDEAENQLKVAGAYAARPVQHEDDVGSVAVFAICNDNRPTGHRS